MSEKAGHQKAAETGSIARIEGRRSEAELRGQQDAAGLVLSMQRAYGNRYVQRLIQSGVLQRKPAAGSSAGPSEASTGAAGVPPIVGEVLRQQGQPLDASTREYMQSRMGHDFGAVRVHTDARAAESANAVDAQAYTVGTSVVFGHGQYSPATSEGKNLLAHELTHVMQQSSGAVNGTGSGRLVMGPDDGHERAADQAANRIAANSGTTRVDQAPRGSAGQTADFEGRLLQRQPKGKGPSIEDRLSALEAAHRRDAAENEKLRTKLSEDEEKIKGLESELGGVEKTQESQAGQLQSQAGQLKSQAETQTDQATALAQQSLIGEIQTKFQEIVRFSTLHAKREIGTFFGYYEESLKDRWLNITLSAFLGGAANLLTDPSAIRVKEPTPGAPPAPTTTQEAGTRPPGIKDAISISSGLAGFASSLAQSFIAWLLETNISDIKQKADFALEEEVAEKLATDDAVYLSFEKDALPDVQNSVDKARAEIKQKAEKEGGQSSTSITFTRILRRARAHWRAIYSSVRPGGKGREVVDRVDQGIKSWLNKLMPFMKEIEDRHRNRRLLAGALGGGVVGAILGGGIGLGLGGGAGLGLGLLVGSLVGAWTGTLATAIGSDLSKTGAERKAQAEREEAEKARKAKDSGKGPGTAKVAEELEDDDLKPTEGEPGAAASDLNEEAGSLTPGQLQIPPAQKNP
jgi:hypothetical protein